MNIRFPIFLAALLVVSTASIVPLLLVEIPPLCDYPAHLSRVYILANVGSDTALAQYYQINEAPVPNMALDIALLMLGKVLGLQTAGLVFAGATLLIPLLGTCLLHRVLFSSWSLWPLVISPFLYHQIFLAGFLNFSFSVGLMLCGVAMWLIIAERGAATRIAISSIFALILYFTHIMGLGLYGLVIGLHGVIRHAVAYRQGTASLRGFAADWAILGVQFLAPLAFFIFMSSLATSDLYERIDQAFDATSWFTQRIQDLWMLGSGYNLRLDIASLAVLASLFAVLILRRRLEFSPVVLPGTLACVALYLAFPSREVLEAGFTHTRFPFVALALLIAGTSPRLPSRIARTAVVAIILPLFAFRTISIGAAWWDYDEVVRDVRRSFAGIERGAKVFIVKPNVPASEIARHIPSRDFCMNRFIVHNHLNLIATIDRSIFLPNNFTNPNKHTINVRPEFRRLDYVDGGVPATLSKILHVWRRDGDDDFVRHRAWRHLASWWRDFDYVAMILPQLGADPAKEAPELLSLVSRNEWIALYRIQKP
jgi:hypothetical protein